MDASDEDGEINLQDWPTVNGMYQPDAIATFSGMSDGKRCEFVFATCCIICTSIIVYCEFKMDIVGNNFTNVY